MRSGNHSEISYQLSKPFETSASILELLRAFTLQKALVGSYFVDDGGCPIVHGISAQYRIFTDTLATAF